MSAGRDREILRLAVPAFLALVAEPLFLLADAAIVGHLGTAPLAGLGVAAVVLQTAVGLCVFLAYGTTASVARRLGAGDLRGALTQGIDGLWLAVLIGTVVTVVGVACTDPLVDLFGVDDAVADHATAYLRIAFLGTIPLLVMLAATGVLRGLQDTRTPLVVAVAGNALNVLLNLLLVYPLGLGIAGSALGSVLAQLASAAAFVVVVVRAARRHGATLRPDLPGIRAAARAGVRAGRAHADPARGAAGHDVRRQPRRRRRHRAAGRPRDPPAGDDAVDLPRLRSRRDRDRRSGPHRSLARRR